MYSFDCFIILFSGNNNKPEYLPGIFGCESTDSVFKAGGWKTDRSAFAAISVKVKTLLDCKKWVTG